MPVSDDYSELDEEAFFVFDYHDDGVGEAG
jgi:hypothetical protein